MHSQPAAVALLNTAANGGRGAALRRPVQAWLARHAPGVSLLTPGSVHEAQALLMILAPRTRVLLIGGDGTLSAMLPALVRRGHRVALVPSGTGNDLARALGLAALPWPEAMALALRAEAAPIDLGEIETEDGSRYFVSSLSAGFDAVATAEADRGPAWLSGRWRFLGAALRCWPGMRTTDLRVWADGQLVHDGAALMCGVFNTPTYGSGLPVAPGAMLQDGRLDWLLAGDIGALRALGLMPAFLTGRHARHPRVKLQPVRKLLIDAAEPLALAADGEVLPSASRVAVHVMPRLLQLVGAPAQPRAARGATDAAAGTGRRG